MRRFLFMPYDRIRGHKPEPESPAPPPPPPPPRPDTASHKPNLTLVCKSYAGDRNTNATKNDRAIDWKSLSIEIFATASRARGYLEAERVDLAKKELDELQKIVDFKLSQKEPRE